MKQQIDKFKGDFRFLSSFWILKIPVIYKGISYFAVENAYVAGKTTDTIIQAMVREMTPGMAKAYGDKILKERLSVNPLWGDEFRIMHMENMVRQKFLKNPDLREKLLATENVIIIEGNIRHDNFFGVCSCGNCPTKKRRPKVGQNNLGKIHMKVRDEFHGGA